MTHHRPLSFALRALLLCVLCAFPFASAGAQSATATLSGTVKDPNNAAVAGAQVTATNNGTGLKRQATTNDSGTFTIPLLPPSTYTILVENQGFAPAQINDVILNVGDNVALKIELKVGEVGATIDVKSEAALIDESPAVGTTVDRTFVENIPLNGRSFNNLITLAPGVSQARGVVGGFNVNGQRSESNYFTIDGVSANSGTSPFSLVGAAGVTGGGLPPVTASGGTQSLLSLDEMQEFTLQTSTYGAKFGRQPGGQISIATRSGTNEYHGTLFEYFRNEALDANDWFANRAGLKRAPMRQHDFGGVFGGPLPLPNFGEGGPAFRSGKDRTFFFFSYEGLRLRVPRTTTFNVPSLSYRNNAHPALRPFFNAYPLPNAAAVNANVGQYIAAFSNPQTTDSYSVRIDHSFAENLTIFGRYHDAPSFSENRDATTLARRNQLNNRTLTLGSTWIINSKMVNDLRFNVSRATGSTRTFFDGFGGSVPFNEETLLPSFVDPSAAQVGFVFSPEATALGAITIGESGNNTQRQINIVDDLTRTHGNHRFQFGLDYRRINPTQKPLPYRVSHTISNAATGLDRISTQVVDAATLEFHNFSLYGDDTWKVTPRLTLTLGLRWEVVPPPTATEGAQPATLTDFNDLSRTVLAQPGTPLWETKYNNFAPRVGAAYVARNNAGWETVVRGGFGVFYDLGLSGITDPLSSAPYSRGREIGAGFTFPGPIEQSTLPAVNFTGPFTQIFVNSNDLKLPYTLQWNFSVEQSLGAKQTITASYVGAAGRRLIKRDTFFTGVNPALLTPGNFNSLSIYDNGSVSDYKALQLQFQRRLSRGFQALVNYTLSRSEDTASQDIDATIPGADTTLFRGISSFDRTHIFSAALTYNLPTPFNNNFARALLGGWSLDSIIRSESAPPINVIVTGDIVLGLGRVANRPDLVPDVPTILEDPTTPGGRRLNPAAFLPVPRSANRFGTLERNGVRWVGFWQADLTLRRQFKLGEKRNLQLRVEAFNVFNHPNFSTPDNRLGNMNAAGVFSPFASFGRAAQMLNNPLITTVMNPVHQVGGARSMQLALRFNF